MALAPLAYLSDLDAMGIPTTDVALAQSLIDSVSEEVRDAAGCPITVTESTITLPGVNAQFIRVPGGPIRSVTSVTLDGTAITDHKIRDGRLWRRSGWGDIDQDVTVTYLHGYNDPPADITRLVCLMVAAGLAASSDNFAGHRGVAYERGDDYQIGYMQGDGENVDPTSLPDRTRRMLQARFSGGAYVTGGY